MADHFNQQTAENTTTWTNGARPHGPIRSPPIDRGDPEHEMSRDAPSQLSAKPAEHLLRSRSKHTAQKVKQRRDRVSFPFADVFRLSGSFFLGHSHIAINWAYLSCPSLHFNLAKMAD